ITELESNLRLRDVFTLVIATGDLRGRLDVDLTEKVCDPIDQAARDHCLPAREALQGRPIVSRLDVVTFANDNAYLARKVGEFAQPRRRPFGQALIGEEVEGFLVHPEKTDQLLPRRLANAVSNGSKDALFQGSHRQPTPPFLSGLWKAFSPPFSPGGARCRAGGCRQIGPISPARRPLIARRRVPARDARSSPRRGSLRRRRG